MTHRTHAPEVIALVYRTVGRTHVFTADGFNGFYIGSHDLKKAFDVLAPALSEHVSLACGCNASYSTEFAYDSFERHIKSGDSTANFVLANRLVGQPADLEACH